MTDQSKLAYAVAKLGAAVDELKGSGDVRGKLFRATMTGLARLFPDDFPDDLRGEYEEIREAISWLPTGGGPSGKVGTTIHAMSEEEASAVADRIIALYWQAGRALHGEEEWARMEAADLEEIEEQPNQDPKIVGPPQPELKMDELQKAVGKTISAVEYGVVEGLPEWVHEGEAIVFHFTDGTALSIEVGSNAQNLSAIRSDLKPEDIHTDLMPIWRDRPPPK